MARRGRPKGACGEESRALLLDMAAKAFAQHGYHETKVSMIVKSASVTQPTFYLYFENKEAIFKELVELFRHRLFQFAEKSRLQPNLDLGTIEGRITHTLTNLLRFFSMQPDLTRIGFYLSAEATQIKTELSAQIKDNLDSEVKEGYFRSDVNTEMVAESLVGMIERLTVTQLFTKRKEPEVIAEEIVQLFLYGLLPNRGCIDNKK